jgi:very-short-patch-repair endonuclease
MDMTWEIYGLGQPEEEYPFHPTRKWRFDYAWIDRKIAVEVDGGIWIRGRSGRGGAHSLPTNILRDMEKSNEAQKLGWRIFRFTPTEIKKGVAQAFMKTVFDNQEA